jgi:hypothetical protein
MQDRLKEKEDECYAKDRRIEELEKQNNKMKEKQCLLSKKL